MQEEDGFPESTSSGKQQTSSQAAKGRQAANASPAAHPSGNSSAASQNTSSPPLGRRRSSSVSPSHGQSPTAAQASAPSPAAITQQQHGTPSAGPLQEAQAAAAAELRACTCGGGSMGASAQQSPSSSALLPPSSQPAGDQQAAAVSALAWPPAVPQAAHAAPAAGQPAALPGCTDLDDVLQQLLTDEELQSLQLEPCAWGPSPAPLEVRRRWRAAGRCGSRAPAVRLPQPPCRAWLHPAPALAPTASPCARLSRPLQPQLALAPVPVSSGALPLGPPPPQALGGGVPLDGLPADLLADIPFVPLPGEMRGAPCGSLPAHSGAAATWHMPSSSMAVDLPGWQHGTRLEQPPALPVAPAVLAATQAMLAPPSLVAAHAVQPLVGYGRPDAAPVSLASDATLTRVSLKVFECTPDQLAPSVRWELETMLQVSAWICRGGCRGWWPEVLQRACPRVLWLPSVSSGGPQSLASLGWRMARGGPGCAQACLRACAHPLRAPGACCCPPPLHLQTSLMEGCMRPGCTHLTLNALVRDDRLTQLKVGPSHTARGTGGAVGWGAPRCPMCTAGLGRRAYTAGSAATSAARPAGGFSPCGHA